MTVVSEDSDYYKLEVKPSLIPNAGNGVFATGLIVKDEIIAEYRGKVFTCGLYEEFVVNCNKLMIVGILINELLEVLELAIPLAILSVERFKCVLADWFEKACAE